MSPLPLPVRLAAGLVATAVEQARDLPRLVVEFPVGRSGLKVNAVSNVSIDVLEGETLGLVG